MILFFLFTCQTSGNQEKNTSTSPVMTTMKPAWTSSGRDKAECSERSLSFYLLKVQKIILNLLSCSHTWHTACSERSLCYRSIYLFVCVWIRNQSRRNIYDNEAMDHTENKSTSMWPLAVVLLALSLQPFPVISRNPFCCIFFVDFLFPNRKSDDH